MSKFTTPLDIEQLKDDLWKLTAPLVYQSDILKITVSVPVGFVTDLESIPRWLPITYAMTYGKAHAPGVVHDFLYQTHKVGDLIVPRDMCDNVLYEAMGADGPGIESMSLYSRYTVWSGVRLGGGAAYESGPSRLCVMWERRCKPRVSVPTPP